MTQPGEGPGRLTLEVPKINEASEGSKDAVAVELRDRARTVLYILERCVLELARLEAEALETRATNDADILRASRESALAACRPLGARFE